MSGSGAVSIRAPAGGATSMIEIAAACRGVSIRAPAGGATRSARARSPDSPSFYPRARRGRDPTARMSHQGDGVSIRAPAGGATLDPVSIAADLVFLSARPQGARRPSCPHRVAYRHQRFYPRARRGRDPSDASSAAAEYRFYPRARRGRDPIPSPGRRMCARFLSARPQGARLPLTKCLGTRVNCCEFCEPLSEA